MGLKFNNSNSLISKKNLKKLVLNAGFSESNITDMKNLSKLIDNFVINIIKNASIAVDNRKAKIISENDIRASLSTFGIGVCNKQSGGYKVDHFKIYKGYCDSHYTQCMPPKSDSCMVLPNGSIQQGGSQITDIYKGYCDNHLTQCMHTSDECVVMPNGNVQVGGIYYKTKKKKLQKGGTRKNFKSIISNNKINKYIKKNSKYKWSYKSKNMLKFATEYFVVNMLKNI